MALTFECENCGKKLMVRFLQAGETAECKNCGAKNIVPETAAQTNENLPKERLPKISAYSTGSFHQFQQSSKSLRPNCARNNVPGEKIIAVASQMKHDGIIRTTWNLIFTNGRVIAIKTGSGSDIYVLAGWGGGAIMTAIAGHRSRGRSKAVQSLPLSEILATDYEKEFLDYATLESITVYPKRLVHSSIVIKERGKKKKKYWGDYRGVIHVSKASDILRQCGAPVEGS